MTPNFITTWFLRLRAYECYYHVIVVIKLSIVIVATVTDDNVNISYMPGGAFRLHSGLGTGLRNLSPFSD